MIDPAIARLAERNMTAHRITTQAATAARPAPHAPAEPAGQWACWACGDAWHGTPPESGTCPDGCRHAA